MSTSAAQRWTVIVAQHEASGQSVREFADARGLNARTLTWWRSALRRKERGRSSSFVELAVVNDGPDPIREVVLELGACGVRARVTATTDFDLLRRVVEALC